MLYEKKDPVHPLSLSRERTILELPREHTLVRTQNITRFALLATLRQIIAYCKHYGRQLSFWSRRRESTQRTCPWMYLWKTYRVVQGCFSIAQRCALETLKDNAEKESLLHPTPSRKLRAEKSSASPLRKQTTRKSQRQPRRIAAPTQWRRRWAAWRRSKRTSRAGSRCGDSTARSLCRVPCRTTEKRRATLP